MDVWRCRWHPRLVAVASSVLSSINDKVFVVRERPPQPILTTQIASRVDLVHPVSKEAGDGTAGGSEEVFGVAAAAEGV